MKKKSCFRKIFILAALLCAAGVFCFASGCVYSDQILLKRAADRTGRSYYDPVLSESGDLSFETTNYLRTNLLMDDFESAPDELLRRFSEKLRKTDDFELLSFKADVCYHQMLVSSDSEEKIRYCVSALSSYYTLLFGSRRNTSVIHSRFEPLYIRSVTRYNTCLAELFHYLRDRSLLYIKSFEIPGALGEKIVFRDYALFKLPLDHGKYADAELCSDYRTENLRHFAYRFGIGVPMIAVLKNESSGGGLRIMEHLARPATCFLRLEPGPDLSVIDGRMEYHDSSETEFVSIRGEKVPLTYDFSTPFAYHLSKLPRVNLLSYMLNPAQDSRCGLYAMEPYDPDKIPVVLVHGLMSSPETWIQLMNSLSNNREIRKNFQFWFFTYSSGNPVLFSASKLRNALDKTVREFDPKGKNEKLRSMVVVGHSMGGLLAKMLAQDSGEKIVNSLLEKKTWSDLKDKLSPEDRNVIAGNFIFNSRHYVSRIIFLAVPHGGSKIAEYGIARLGIFLTRLPAEVVRLTSNAALKIFASDLADKNKMLVAGGIANLSPSHPILLALNGIPLARDKTYHSIVGNKREAGVPGGTDGIVPYSSSHLDCVESELIVKSGHSVQENPETVVELARILHEHLEKLHGKRK